MNDAPLDRRFLLGGLAGVAGVSALAAMTKAGPLNPPGGAVASTGKTLTDVEPRTAVNAANTPGAGGSTFRITLPGSYYLTGNIQLAGTGNGVEIVANGVTLDLNGFTIDGGNIGGPSSSTGVLVNGPRSDVTVCNGHVTNFGSIGVSVPSSSSSGIELRNLTIGSANSIGIDALCPGVRLTDCSVRGGGIGLQLGAGAVVQRCSVRGTLANGLVVFDGSTLTACSAHACQGSGFNIGGAGSTVTGCAALGNSQSGFLVAGASVLTACTARGNGASGISARTANTLRNNRCNAHTTAGGAGILLSGATAGLNHLEGNACGSNYRGYSVQSAGNLFLRNTATNNLTHWQVAAGNYLQIVTPASPPAFTGPTGGLPLAASGYDPNANFTL